MSVAWSDSTIHNRPSFDSIFSSGYRVETHQNGGAGQPHPFWRRLTLSGKLSKRQGDNQQNHARFHIPIPDARFLLTHLKQRLSANVAHGVIFQKDRKQAGPDGAHPMGATITVVAVPDLKVSRALF